MSVIPTGRRQVDDLTTGAEYQSKVSAAKVSELDEICLLLIC